MAHPPPSESAPPADRRRVTMRDVARLAGGVHPSTVSLALRNHPAISAATRQRIQQAATEAGYRRDPLLDAFNARRASAVQHRAFPVVAFAAGFGSLRELNASPLHAAIWRGVALAAQSLYHRAELFLVGRGALAPERLESVLYTRGIDCFVVAPMDAGVPPLRLKWERYCAVKIGCLEWAAPQFTIAPDLLQGARLAVRQVRSRGYARIALALAPGQATRSDLLRAGYLIEQNQTPELRAVPPLLLPATLAPRQVREWIESQRVDAVLSDTLEFGTLLTAAGLVAGRDVGWACLGLPPGIATVAGVVADYERLGALAMEQVVSLSRMNQRGAPRTAMVTYVPVDWHDGDSLPARR